MKSFHVLYVRLLTFTLGNCIVVPDSPLSTGPGHRKLISLKLVILKTHDRHRRPSTSVICARHRVANYW